jgi:hypothetical protein
MALVRQSDGYAGNSANFEEILGYLPDRLEQYAEGLIIPYPSHAFWD